MASAQTHPVLRHIRGLTVAEDADRQLLERFVTAREEAAFAGLVRRHGPLVMGVCRRVLHDPDDAEDAFQATFLALARRAGSVGRRAALGTWLYQVAYYAALRVRKRTASRRQRERKAPPRQQADPLAEVTGRELLTVLDEELQRLPERLRAPLVLCYLQGRTRDEAAHELGWSLGTFKRRLEQGRAGLHARLSRRGISLGALLAGGLAAGAVSSARAAAVARAALVAAGARASLSPLLLAVVISSLIAVGAGLLAYHGAGAAAATPDANSAPQVAPAKEAAPARAAAQENKEQLVSGRVLDPDGKPAAGANVYYLRSLAPGEYMRVRFADRPRPKPEAVTDQDGRFSFPARADKGQLFVTAPGYGPAWVLKPGRLDDNPLRLARDDVTISGRVLDLQGQPVAGATIRVRALKAPLDGTLDKWLGAVKTGRDGMSAENSHLGRFSHVDLPHFFPPVTTDRDGRFQIKGSGRDRVVALIVESPAIETRQIQVVTRPGVAAFNAPDQWGEERLTYYPPTFNHAAAPGRVVSGVVRDKQTGKPVAGATVRLSEDASPSLNPVYFIRTTTDREGRYRLTGLPQKLLTPVRNDIIVLPPDDEPYLALRTGLPENDARPAVYNFDLPRGVWLEGQVKDKATGHGVPARLGYFIFGNGARDAELQALYIPPMPGLAHFTDRDGKFRIVAAPYRGMIGARLIGDASDHYRVGMGADAIEGRKKEAGDFSFDTYPHTASAGEFETLAEVKPEAGAKSVRCDLLLDPGRTVTVRVRGPDGKPLAGVQAHGQFARQWWEREKLPAEFPVYGLGPGEGRTLLLRHEGKQLVGRCEIKADERGPVVAALQPAASVAVKVVGDAGRPVAGAEITVYFRQAKDGPRELHSRDFHTGADGFFRIEGLMPGLIYSADVRPAASSYLRSIFDGLTLRPGEAKDLGTVKPKKGDE
jgi:RNA polymerase sigma factor (sigma-70 family)